jgi:hypothetical protein
MKDCNGDGVQLFESEEGERHPQEINASSENTVK